MTRLLLLLFALLVVVAPAGADEDHEDAYRALQAGEVLSFDAVLEKLRDRFPGEVVEVEFERSGGVWVYELEMLMPDGRMLEIYADARSGAVLKVEQD